MDMDVERAVEVAWAKSSPHIAPEYWLPLWQHLDDTADIAGFLWDDWVSPVVQETIGRALPGGAADGRRLLVWLAGVHDVGKASPTFAAQVGALSDRMSDHGLRGGAFTVDDRAKLRHEVAGAAALETWLATRTAFDPEQRAQLTSVVAGHHGGFHRAADVRRPRTAWFGDGLWAVTRDALVDRAAHRAGVLERFDEWVGARLPQTAVHLLTALVVMADWIASDEDHFDLLPLDVVPAIAPMHGPSERALRAWKRVRLSSRWSPVLPTDGVEAVFLDRFPDMGGAPRPVQRAVADLARSMPAPGLVVVEAPMGVGKTEAALLAAETLAARCGAAGIAWALPTQATSNAMFSRVRRFTERLPTADGGRQSIALVHGKAVLNDEFGELRFGRPRSVHDGDSTDKRRVTVAADQWTRGRKRAALSTFVVGTIDQVLFTALVARHLVLRQLAFAGKVVVVDEVHSADVYMSTFLDRALEWLGAAGAPVVLLSATLPAARRADLYVAYERGRRLRLALPGDEWEDAARRALDGDIGYPAVVTTGADGPEVTTFPRSPDGQVVHVHRLADDPATLADLLASRLRDGGCAVVVRDTVTRAQQTATDLAALLPDVEVTLVHARFLDGVRLAHDADLLHRFGPPGSGAERPHRHVVVATQVVEQSLDVDFDLMVTDVAPVDLMLQRVGRLHRHRRPGRPLAEAHLYVTGVRDWSASVPAFAAGVSAVYQPWLLLRALAVLGPHLDGVPLDLPADIARLVQAAYAEEADEPPSWRAALDDAHEHFARSRDERTRRARYFALPSPHDLGGTLYGLDRMGVGQIDEDTSAQQGYVRDGGDSIEVVVVQHGTDASDRVPDWLPEHGGEALPFRHVELTSAQARTLARCTLRLPAGMCVPDRIDAVISELEGSRFEGWARSPLLAGQLALVLDDDGCAHVAGFDLRYDERLGLVAERRGGPGAPPPPPPHGGGGAADAPPPQSGNRAPPPPPGARRGAGGGQVIRPPRPRKRGSDRDRRTPTTRRQRITPAPQGRMKPTRQPRHRSAHGTAARSAGELKGEGQTQPVTLHWLVHLMCVLLRYCWGSANVTTLQAPITRPPERLVLHERAVLLRRGRRVDPCAHH